MGDYTRGLKNYEWRKKVKNPIRVHVKTMSDEWNGEEKLLDNKLLVISEQGLGDNFQFIRYLIYMNRLGYEITYCAPKKLHSIIISSGINVKLITLDKGVQFYILLFYEFLLHRNLYPQPILLPLSMMFLISY